MRDSCGYITVACGERRYLEMATDLALSLRDFDDKPVALVLGDELRAAAGSRQLAVFDHVVPLPAGYRPFHSKLAAPSVTPFDRSLFIDADALAIGPLEHVWQALDGDEFAVQGRYVGPEEDHEHHFLSTAALTRHFGLARYLRHNSGVLYFRKEKGQAVSAACMRVWSEGFGRELPFDEPLRGVLGEALGIATMPKPYPMAWWPNLVAPGEAKFRLVHFMGTLRADTLTWLLRHVRRRREAAGLPSRDSLIAWMNKATRGRMPWLPLKLPHLAHRGALAERNVELPPIGAPTP